MTEQTMEKQKLSLLTVDQLRLNEAEEPQRYVIEKYQRGYRWSKLQVRQLLNDILEFSEKHPGPDEFYCLQPLVLRKSAEGGFEVVDGQQRLTTILLILRYLNEQVIEKRRFPVYTIEYRTRPDLLEFLDDPTEEKAEANADYFHLFQAKNVVEEWFDQNEAKLEDVKSKLRNQTKVIWFQLTDNDNPVEAFTRLNVGKIPLTNDELIRALFLKRDGDDQSEAEDLQRQIANEWDQIEKELQADDFWYFITNQSGWDENRIRFLFELIAHADGLTDDEKGDDYGVFYAFNRRLGDGGKIKEEWKRIKQAFLTLQEWYEDPVLFHIVGFLIHEGVSVQQLRNIAEGCSKSQFENALRARVYTYITQQEFPTEDIESTIVQQINEVVEGLSYLKQSEHRRIRAVLLLFNIATLLENPSTEDDNGLHSIRFQFGSFKAMNWHIEHIRSVGSDRLDNYSEWTQWLQLTMAFLQTNDKEKELRKSIEAFLKIDKVEVDERRFAGIYKQVVESETFKEDWGEEPDHSIANLALLDQVTNQSYKNAMFAVKRQKLLSIDRAGTFVPLCTRNVFLKCYGEKVDHLMSWSEEDREAYKKALVDTLAGFFDGVNGGDE